ncbi:MAG: protease inhibitor I42 family protein [Bacteroidota bacterium]
MLFKIIAHGGNAIETWTFIGLQKGDYQLVFNYKRPWEEEIVKTEKISVTVH